MLVFFPLDLELRREMTLQNPLTGPSADNVKRIVPSPLGCGSVVFFFLKVLQQHGWTSSQVLIVHFDSLPWIDADLEANFAERKGFVRKRVATATSIHSWTLISFCFSAIFPMVVMSQLLQWWVRFARPQKPTSSVLKKPGVCWWVMLGGYMFLRKCWA